MNRRVRGLVVFGVAVATAGLASAGVHRHIQRRATTVHTDTRPVMVAARALPMGTRLSREDVKAVTWPRDAMPEGALASPELIVGRSVIRTVAANEPLTEETAAPPGAGAGLPPAIPPGMRAISVKVDDVVSVAGFAVPGSRVDVLVALRASQEPLARAVASNVQVLAVGTRRDLEQGLESSKSSTVVTLLVSPSDAERISLASIQGSITLTLRNPLDADATSTGGVRLASLVGQSATAPPPVVRAPRAIPPPPAPVTGPDGPRVHTIETIRGGKRTEETIR